MLRCIIADDEAGGIEILSRYINRTEGLQLLGAFRDSIEALSFLAGNAVDLAFLDINMPGLDGMKLAGLIRDGETRVVFCTAYAEYAVESYEKGALDYLLKPIAYERFLMAVDKAKKLFSEGSRPAAQPRAEAGESKGRREKICERRIFIKSGPRLHQVYIENILFMEKKDHYVVFHTSEGEILSRMNMTDLLNSLPSEEFVRVHRSFVVAVHKIDTIDRHQIQIGDVKIPIGDRYREHFFNKIRFTGG